MTRNETIKALKICKGIWPKYYEGKDNSFLEPLVNEWFAEFDRAPYEYVINACYSLATKLKLHPTVDEVRKTILDDRGNVPYSFGSERPTAEDWAQLKRLYKKQGMEWPEDKTGREIECS